MTNSREPTWEKWCDIQRLTNANNITCNNITVASMKLLSFRKWVCNDFYQVPIVWDDASIWPPSLLPNGAGNDFYDSLSRDACTEAWTFAGSKWPASTHSNPWASYSKALFGPEKPFLVNRYLQRARGAYAWNFLYEENLCSYFTICEKKQLYNEKNWACFARAFRVRSLYGTSEKRAPGSLHAETSEPTLAPRLPARNRAREGVVLIFHFNRSKIVYIFFLKICS